MAKPPDLYKMYMETPSKVIIDKYNLDFVHLDRHTGFLGERAETQGIMVSCSCLAHTADCRHKKMYEQFKKRGELGGTRFFLWDNKKGEHKWMPPFPADTAGLGESDW